MNHEWFKTRDVSSNDNNSNVEGRSREWICINDSNLSLPIFHVYGTGSQIFRNLVSRVEKFAYSITRSIKISRETRSLKIRIWSQAFCINFSNSNMRNSPMSFVTKLPSRMTLFCSIARYLSTKQTSRRFCGFHPHDVPFGAISSGKISNNSFLLSHQSDFSNLTESSSDDASSIECESSHLLVV